MSERYQNVARGLEWLNFQVAVVGSSGGSYSTIPSSSSSSSSGSLEAALVAASNSTRRLLEAGGDAQWLAGRRDGVRQLLVDTEQLAAAAQDLAQGVQEAVSCGSVPLAPLLVAVFAQLLACFCDARMLDRWVP